MLQIASLLAFLRHPRCSTFALATYQLIPDPLVAACINSLYQTLDQPSGYVQCFHPRQRTVRE